MFYLIDFEHLINLFTCFSVQHKLFYKINNVSGLNVLLAQEINLQIRKCNNNADEKCSGEKPQEMRGLLFTILFKASLLDSKLEVC